MREGSRFSSKLRSDIYLPGKHPRSPSYDYTPEGVLHNTKIFPGKSCVPALAAGLLACWLACWWLSKRFSESKYLHWDCKGIRHQHMHDSCSKYIGGTHIAKRFCNFLTAPAAYHPKGLVPPDLASWRLHAPHENLIQTKWPPNSPRPDQAELNQDKGRISTSLSICRDVHGHTQASQ